ncbi:MAG: sugar ABC transporter substrate-binding protein [Actinomycetaceae bacterium]|nr:sugar ABC transporter substrate-binding protein [Actinomycetaceae bacterium]
MKLFRHAARFAALTSAGALALTACSPGSSGSDESEGGTTVVTFRLWDENAVEAYEESFDEFSKQNPDIKVTIETVAWDKYWDQLPLDISSGDMADIYWVNSSNFAQYADSGDLMDIGEVIGTDHEQWQQSVVDLYTRNGKLWGVPQLWDSIGLFYNRDMVEAAGVDVDNLAWAPGGGQGDTLLSAARQLTTDSAGRRPGDDGFDATNIDVYGFNAQADMQAIYLPFLAEAGADFQDSDGKFAFDSEEGRNAFGYLVDMINEHHVAPAASDTNTDGDSTRDLFVQGKLALYQSGPYNLKTIAEDTDVNWGLAPLVAGPQGRSSTVHGVVAVGNAKTKHKQATIEVLKWLGTSRGQLPLAEKGVSLPGAVGAQDAFISYWQAKGVDVSPFLESARGQTAKPPVGPAVNAGTEAFTPKLLDMFLGSVPVDEGLRKAQEAGNKAMK